MKLVGASLIAFALSVEATHQIRPEWRQKKNKALRILSAHRRARDNNDLFEEIQKGDLERECVEEKCDYEELRETYEDEGEADAWWAKAVRKCTNDLDKDKCHPQHTAKCINQWQAKTCQCKRGWEGPLCKKDQNECANPEIAQKCGGKQCINTEGSYRCGCEDGFTLQDDKSCKDVDECKEGNTKCAHNCVNTEGSFECACNDGYILSDDGFSCNDVNECDDVNDVCGENSSCSNNMGGYDCECDAGYSHGFGDTVSRTCEDVNECESVECPLGSVCENTIGSYTCKCPDGLKYEDGECVDIDECEAGVCGNWGCRNVHGSYSCSCYKGWQPADTESRSDSSGAFDCEDIDECTTGAHDCNEGSQVCVNEEGSFTCDCAPGFEAIGEVCQDVDECTNNPCPEGEHCYNSQGSYQCMDPNAYNACGPGTSYQIPDGGSGDDGECEDIDECAVNNGNCHQNCQNTEWNVITGKGHQCTCYAGYEDINGVCEDIDECSGDVCQNEGNNQCINTEGSYECACQSGFTRNEDLLTCSDIDECNNHQCEVEGEVCHNFPGGFQCISEVVSGCAADNKCDHQCNDNEDGSVDCSCWPGYVLSCDGHTCLKDFDAEVSTDDMLSQGDCPAAFVKLGGKYSTGCSACFFASMDKSDRDQAAKVCEGLGASLAVVENKEQNFYLSELFSAEEQFWIGARFDTDEDDFMWDDGSVIKFSRWAKNEPSTALADVDAIDPEHCVVGNWGYPGHWNDLPCAYNEARYACSMMHSCDGVPQKQGAASPVSEVEEDDEEEYEGEYEGDYVEDDYEDEYVDDEDEDDDFYTQMEK